LNKSHGSYILISKEEENMNSKFTLLLAAVFVVGFLAACQDNSGSQKTEYWTVSFDTNGGTPETIPPIKVVKGESMGSQYPDDPDKDGYDFSGWYKDSTIYTVGIEITSDIMLTAQWTPTQEGQPEADIAALFDPAKGFPENLSNSWKIWGHHNALITQGFGADPTAIEYNGRVYLFASNDTILYDANGAIANGTYSGGIQGIRSISSADLVNWTDHGVLNIAGPAFTDPLVTSNTTIIAPGTYAERSWAPAIEMKEFDGIPKFFLYYANSGNGIGVITAPHPTGPWTSPLDKLLIDRNTPTCAASGDVKVTTLFDPGVLVDDDGKGYIFFGGGDNTRDTASARRARLGDDMISLDGDPEVFMVPSMFEASDINKINGRYYFSYVLNSSAASPLYNTQIAYMLGLGDDPMGDFGSPVGFMRAANTQLSSDDNNNHHAIFRFKDNYYIAYHASRVKYAMGANKNGGYYRSSHIDNVTINSDGSIAPVTMTSQGVNQVGRFDPYVQNEAETIGIMGGIFTRADDGAGNGMVVTAIDSGDWVALYGVDFGSGAKRFSARVRTPETPDYVGAIELRLDPTAAGDATTIAHINTTTRTARVEGGEVIGRLVIKAVGGREGEYETVTINLDKNVSGVHNLVFVFYSSLGDNPITPANLKASKHKDGFEFDQWQFFRE
jgi:arabinoxylan arabinofuranohydrolase